LKNKSDSDLVLQAQRELPYNTTAFEILINKYQKRIFNVCFQVLKDYHLAEDATQNTMLRIFHYLKNFKNDSSFFTWVYTISKNESLQLINKNKNNLYVDEIFEVDNSYENLFKGIIVDQIYKNLTEEETELLVLNYTLEFKDEEIAALKEISLSACKMRLKRLKEKILEFQTESM
jgi:RNA polymerase sigma factor (sigma-70 family)